MEEEEEVEVEEVVVEEEEEEEERDKLLGTAKVSQLDIPCLCVYDACIVIDRCVDGEFRDLREGDVKTDSDMMT